MAEGHRPKGKIARSSAGLRDALFDAIERVRDGDMIADDAKAIAMTAKEICNTVRLEMEVSRLRKDAPSDAKLVFPAPLNLGPPDSK